MRILFKGLVHPTSLAKSLKKELASHGHTVGIRTCEEIVAKMMGYDSWYVLRLVSSTTSAPSPRDEEVTDETVAARRSQFNDVLARYYGPHLAQAIVDKIRPTGRRTDAPSRLEPETAGSHLSFQVTFVAYADASRERRLMKAWCDIKIKRLPYGNKPAFSGSFFVPKRSEVRRPQTTELEVYRYDDAFYSRLRPIIGSAYPEHFGRTATMQGELSWDLEPRNGVLDHPLIGALERHRSIYQPELRVCPPHWDFVSWEGDREKNHARSAVYQAFRRSENREADQDTYPDLPTEKELVDAGYDIRSTDIEEVSALIRKAADEQLLIVGDKLMIRTAEPFWKLSISETSGHLRLDLVIARETYEKYDTTPVLYFAMDEIERRDAAIARLLPRCTRQKLLARGQVKAIELGASLIDGIATSIANLTPRIVRAGIAFGPDFSIETINALKRLEEVTAPLGSVWETTRKKGKPGIDVGEWFEAYKNLRVRLTEERALSPKIPCPWARRMSDYLAMADLLVEHQPK